MASDGKPKVRIGSLSEFRPTTRNPNKHTQRGLSLLEDSVEQDGYVAPMTVAADGESLDGSARMEVCADKFDGEVIVVEHTGDRPVVMVRTDIENAETEHARRVIHRANRVAQVDLDFDPVVMLEDLELGVPLGDWWFSYELNMVLGSEGEDIDYDELWRGMPEFEQKDLTSVKSINVHFASMEDVIAFAELVNQKITEKTKYIWFPEQQRTNCQTTVYVDES